MKLYSPVIEVFFREEMALSKNIDNSRSKSPLKPQKLIEYIFDKKVDKAFRFNSQFKHFTKKDFYIAHHKAYVDAFFRGRKYAVENINIDWSREMANSIKWTNSSLYHSILNSIKTPDVISLSPTSGFHHARPEQGKDFCSFSGQVIASSKIYDELGLSGCYIDLDAHYGNSIEDSRKFVPNLNEAIPKGFNINPTGEGEVYIKNLKKSLDKLRQAIIDNKIHYVVFCHGADSHIEDDLKCGSLTTEQWLLCSELVYSMIDETSKQIGRSVPFILSLFGGYRNDNYEFVLDLHLKSILNATK